jgi:hypothetical protein
MHDPIDALFDAECRGRVHVTPTKITTRAEVEARLVALSGDGWVCTTHRVERWKGGALPADVLPASGLLSAEIRTSGAVSVHLRYAGDHWLFVEISEERRKLADALEGDDYAFDELFVSNLDAKGAIRMHYRTWWSLKDDVYRPWVARFLGFEQRGAR